MRRVSPLNQPSTAVASTTITLLLLSLFTITTGAHLQRYVICKEMNIHQCFMWPVRTEYEIEKTKLPRNVDKTFTCLILDVTTLRNEFQRRHLCKSINVISTVESNLPSVYETSKVFSRLRRSASSSTRGRYRGQTQSQYLAIDRGNNKDEGVAEAHSAADSSRATVSGNSGMGQAQSQSMYDPNCNDCLGRNDIEVQSLQRRPGELPGTTGFGNGPIRGWGNEASTPAQTGVAPSEIAGNGQTPYSLNQNGNGQYGPGSTSGQYSPVNLIPHGSDRQYTSKGLNGPGGPYGHGAPAGERPGGPYPPGKTGLDGTSGLVPGNMLGGRPSEQYIPNGPGRHYMPGGSDGPPPGQYTIHGVIPDGQYRPDGTNGQVPGGGYGPGDKRETGAGDQYIPNGNGIQGPNRQYTPGGTKGQIPGGYYDGIRGHDSVKRYGTGGIPAQGINGQYGPSGAGGQIPGETINVRGTGTGPFGPSFTVDQYGPDGTRIQGSNGQYGPDSGSGQGPIRQYGANGIPAQGPDPKYVPNGQGLSRQYGTQNIDRPGTGEKSPGSYAGSQGPAYPIQSVYSGKPGNYPSGLKWPPVSGSFIGPDGVNYVCCVANPHNGISLPVSGGTNVNGLVTGGYSPGILDDQNTGGYQPGGQYVPVAPGGSGIAGQFGPGKPGSGSGGQYGPGPPGGSGIGGQYGPGALGGSGSGGQYIPSARGGSGSSGQYIPSAPEVSEHYGPGIPGGFGSSGQYELRAPGGSGPAGQYGPGTSGSSGPGVQYRPGTSGGSVPGGQYGPGTPGLSGPGGQHVPDTPGGAGPGTPGGSGPGTPGQYGPGLPGGSGSGVQYGPVTPGGYGSGGQYGPDAPGGSGSGGQYGPGPQGGSGFGGQYGPGTLGGSGSGGQYGPETPGGSGPVGQIGPGTPGGSGAGGQNGPGTPRGTGSGGQYGRGTTGGSGLGGQYGPGTPGGSGSGVQYEPGTAESSGSGGQYGPGTPGGSGSGGQYGSGATGGSGPGGQYEPGTPGGPGSGAQYGPGTQGGSGSGGLYGPGTPGGYESGGQYGPSTTGGSGPGGQYGPGTQGGAGSGGQYGPGTPGGSGSGRQYGPDTPGGSGSGGHYGPSGPAGSGSGGQYGPGAPAGSGPVGQYGPGTLGGSGPVGQYRPGTPGGSGPGGQYTTGGSGSSGQYGPGGSGFSGQYGPGGSGSGGQYRPEGSVSGGQYGPGASGGGIYVPAVGPGSSNYGPGISDISGGQYGPSGGHYSPGGPSIADATGSKGGRGPSIQYGPGGTVVPGPGGSYGAYGPGNQMGGDNSQIPPQNVIDPNSVADGDDSEAEASVAQAVNGTVASASSKGGNDKGRAQTHVTGTYTGSGSFSAQAEIMGENKAANSEVSGDKKGASSAAQGSGRNNKSQANVKLGSETGAVITGSQSEGVLHSSNSQVQGSVKGGMADAQARGPGSTSSQAQIGFTPFKEGDKSHVKQKIPFVGGGVATAQSNGRTGMSQSQLHGTFKYGITYNGAAQAGASLDKDAVFPNKLSFDKIDVFDEENKNINVDDINIDNSAHTEDITDLPPEVLPEGSTNVPFEVDTTEPNKEENNKNSDEYGSHSHSDHHTSSDALLSTTRVPPVESRRSFKPNYSNNHGDYEYSTDKDDNLPEDYDDEGYGPDVTDQAEGDQGYITSYNEFSRDQDGTHQPLLSQNKKVLEVRQTTGGNTQHILLGTLADHDAEITQRQSERPDESKVYQPGERIPGTGGYTIPIGFTGSVKSVASKDKTYVVGSKESPSQAQTVSLTPGNGRVKYTYPPYGRNINPKNLRSLYNPRQDENNRYVSVSKSVTRDLDSENNIRKQYSHTYYTKSSSCGYFTFTCTMVSSAEGKKRVCKPKIPQNPDGSPIRC